MTKKETEAARAQSITLLKGWIRPGDTVTTVLRHVSTSGMYRAIDVYKFEDVTATGRVSKYWLSFHVSRAVGFKFDERRNAVGVSGVGMDMGFHIVYALSSVLFRDNFYCIGEGCPSNDHNNGDISREDGKLQNYRHRDGGYALRHEWL